MLKKLKRVFEGIADDFGYFLKRGSAFILGKTGGQIAGEGMAIAAVSMLGVIGSFEAIIATTLAAGAVAGVSVGLVQSDFLHRRNQLVDRYREEVGSVLNKAPDKVQEADLELISRGDFKNGLEANPAIRQELKNSWLERNVGAILSTAVAVTTFLLVHSINPASYFMPEIANELAHGAAHVLASAVSHPEVLLELAGVLGINGLAGFATYHTIKTPLHIMSAQIFGIEENTVNDQITEIKRTLGHSRSVSPEQVLGVFIQAHQDVAEQLKAEYGKEYENMHKSERQQILSVIQQYMDINSLTEDINKGRMRPEELAFISFGQQSGIGKQDDGTFKHHGNIIDGMWHGLSAITHGFHSTARPTSGEEMSSYVGNMPGTTTYTVTTPDENSAHLQIDNSFEEPGRKQSFTARVGRKIEDNGMSHVERLEQSSNQEVMLTSPAR